MKKSVLRKSFVAILLLGNILLLANYFLRPPHPRHEGPRNEIITILHFDENQIRQYDILIEKHQNDIQNAEKKLIVVKDKLYANLDQPIDSVILTEVSEKQVAIEEIHYKHFQDIKALCKPNQLIYFKQLNKKIASLFSHRMKPKR